MSVAPGRSNRRGPRRQAETVKNLASDGRILDGCQNAHPRAAARAFQDIHRENPRHQLSPGVLRGCGFCSSAVFRCPQGAAVEAGGGTGTMEGRSFAAEARIPKYRTRWKRGAGTRAESFSSNSLSLRMTCVVPSRQGVFIRYASRPEARRSKRSTASGGLNI